MPDSSQQEFIAKATAQLAADIGKKKVASQARAHPTQQQKEAEEQERLRRIAYRLPSSGKPVVDSVALERAEKARETRKYGKPIPSQITMGAQRIRQPGEF